MIRLLLVLSGAALLLGAALPACAQDPVYRDPAQYPVLDQIRADRTARQAVVDSLVALAEARAAERRERRDQDPVLRVDWSQVDLPSGPDAFDAAWHQPPTPQYYTGSCWAFCSISFLESEIHRRHGREVKLSEMWIVYWEYVEKARRFLREYGHSVVAEGSQDHGTLEVGKRYGLVPRAAYPGVLTADGRYDHTPLIQELTGYLDWVREADAWDEAQNLLVVRGILDKHMGRPPEEFTYQGETYTAERFRDQVCALDLERYVSCVSRLDAPFGTRVLLDVRDNWRRKDDYLNLPLDQWYGALRATLEDGATVSLGGDNSEPGMDGLHDAGIIPPWDIPGEHLDQAARELRIVNGTTSDDHGVHAVAIRRHAGQDWLLIKDSNRSSRLGRFPGYYMWTGDYVRLKMLSFLVHQDRLEGLISPSTR